MDNSSIEVGEESVSPVIATILMVAGADSIIIY